MRLNRGAFLLLFSLFLTNLSYSQTNNRKEVENVIENYFTAIGGKKRASRITSFVSKSKGKLKGKEVDFILKLQLPHKYLTLLSVGDYLVSKKTFNGKEGYRIQQDIQKELSNKDIKKFKRYRSIFPEFDYLEKATYKGISNLDTKKVHVLKLRDSHIYYDTETGLKIRSVTTVTKNNYTFKQTIHYLKYISIEKLKFPSKIIIEAGTNKLELQTTTILLNSKIDANEFN